MSDTARPAPADFAYDYAAGFDDAGDKNAWFAQTIENGSRVLEVGCATGYVGEYLATRLGCRVVGIEIHEAAAEAARARACYEFVRSGDAQDPATYEGMEAASFDIVMFGDVLEHLVNPEAALHAVAPLLAPGGRIQVCVPNIVHWSMRRRLLMGKFEYTETGLLDRTHLRFFTDRSARDLVQGAGYEITRVGGVLWLPGLVRRLPDRVLRITESLARRTLPNLFHGQILVEATLIEDAAPTP